MKIAINSEHSGKHPTHLSDQALKAWWAWFNGGFKNVETSLSGLEKHIYWGHAYTTQHADYRKASNYLGGQHVGLDFDRLVAGTTIESIVDDDPFIAGYAALLHTTASHTPQEPRIRVLFVLDRPIREALKYTLLAEALLDRYDLADPSCKDACRLFFGAEGCETLLLGNVMTLEDAADLLVLPYREKLEQQHEPAPQIEPVGSGNVPPGILERHSRRLLQHIADAPEGEKYYRLRDISRTFGGYIAGGYYDELSVKGWLEAEIRARTTVKNLNAAYRTIGDGIAYGKADPLYFDLGAVSQAISEKEETLGMAIDGSWRSKTVGERVAELEALISELEGVDPAYLPAVEEYGRLKGLSNE